MAPRWSLLLLLRSQVGKERERGGDRMERLGARGGVPTGLSRSAGRPRPRRRRTAATWPAPGGARRAHPHAGEGRGSWAARLSGPKGRRVGPAAPAPFFFFLIFFLNSFSKFILANLKPFLALSPKTKVVTNKKFYNFASS